MAFIRNLVTLIAIVTTNIATAANELTPELSIDDARHLLGRTGFGASAYQICLLYTSPSPRDGLLSRMPSSA